MADLPPGSQFAGCRIEGVLGRGGMGVIYRATDVRLGRAVALKLIATDRAADPEVRERFEREARATASIEHPNVVPVYAAGEEDGCLYLVMRYVPGTDLDAVLRAERRLDPTRAATVVAQVAAALDAAHAAGLVHRDVKPANVLLAGTHVYLSDFGITRVQSSMTRITESGNWIGTVDYMAPEHLRGEPTDARSDVYALGCVLHTALTGVPPFRRETVPATITAHLHEQPPRASSSAGVPPTFDAVLARALAKAPEDRYPSAGDLGQAALAAAAGAAPAAPQGSVAVGAAAPDGAEPTLVAPQPEATVVVGAGAATTVLAPPPLPPAGASRRGQPSPNGRPGAVRIQRSRRRRIAVGATVAVLAIPAAGVALWATHDDTPTGPLAAGEVRRAAHDFADAYTREDGAALRRLLTPDVQRVGVGNAIQRGRAAVVAEYDRQFAAGNIRSYALSGLRATGGPVGRASGRYTVTRAGSAPLRGRLVLGVVRRHGRAEIRLIATEARG